MARDAPNSVVNSARVDGGGELATGNNTASDPTTIIGFPDMVVDKSHSGDFTAGGSGAFQLVVRNIGTDPSTGEVTVTDTLPAPLAPTTAGGTGWTCTIAGQAVTCRRSDVLGAGAAYPTISLTVQVAATASGEVTNSATVAGRQITVANDVDEDSVTILGAPDLAITKLHTNDFARALTGEYLISVSNVGVAASAGEVVVTDTPPTGLTPTGATGTGWSCSIAGRTVTCRRSDVLGRGEAYPQITLTVAVAANAPNEVTNVAAVSGGGDPNVLNNSASDLTTIGNAADRRVTKTASGAFVVGQTGVYVIRVSNAAGAGATSAVTEVTDTLPEGLTYVSATGDGWLITPSEDLRRVDFAWTDSIDAGAAATDIVLTVAVAPTAPPSVTNQVVVVPAPGTAEEAPGANNTATTVTPIQQRSDLALTMTAAPEPVVAGQSLTLSLRATNSGPSIATAVSVSLPLPPGTTFTSGTPGCTATAGTVTCPIGTLPPSAGTDLTITLVPTIVGPLALTATLTAPEPDPTPVNNTATTQSTVLAPTPTPTNTPTPTATHITHRNGDRDTTRRHPTDTPTPTQRDGDSHADCHRDERPRLRQTARHARRRRTEYGRHANGTPATETRHCRLPPRRIRPSRQARPSRPPRRRRRRRHPVKLRP